MTTRTCAPRRQIRTGLADDDEARLSCDAIPRVEKTLVASLPKEVLAIARNVRQGYRGNPDELLDELEQRLP